MDFQILLVKEELNYLEEAAYNLLRIEHVRKTDRKIIVESFKKIKRRLKKITDYPFYMIAGSDEEKLIHPKTLGHGGCKWTAGKWSLAFVEPRTEDSPSENLFEAIFGGANIIDYECSLDLE